MVSTAPVSGVVKVGAGEAERWGDEFTGVVGVVAVQAEQGIEVDCAAGLVIGACEVRKQTITSGHMPPIQMAAASTE